LPGQHVVPCSATHHSSEARPQLHWTEILLSVLQCTAACGGFTANSIGMLMHNQLVIIQQRAVCASCSGAAADYDPNCLFADPVRLRQSSNLLHTQGWPPITEAAS
jgi:hypothetical protein